MSFISSFILSFFHDVHVSDFASFRSCLIFHSLALDDRRMNSLIRFLQTNHATIFDLSIDVLNVMKSFLAIIHRLYLSSDSNAWRILREIFFNLFLHHDESLCTIHDQRCFFTITAVNSLEFEEQWSTMLIHKHSQNWIVSMTTENEIKKWNVKWNVDKISRQSEMREWSEARSLKLNTINVKCTIDCSFTERDVIILLFISFFFFFHFLLRQNIMQSWRSLYLMMIFFLIFNDDDFSVFTSSYESLSVKFFEESSFFNQLKTLEMSKTADDHIKIRFILRDFDVAFSISIFRFIFHDRAFTIDSWFLNHFFIRYQTFLVCFKTSIVSFLTFVANTKNDMFDKQTSFDDNVLSLDNQVFSANDQFSDDDQFIAFDNSLFFDDQSIIFWRSIFLSLIQTIFRMINSIFSLIKFSLLLNNFFLSSI